MTCKTIFGEIARFDRPLISFSPISQILIDWNVKVWEWYVLTAIFRDRDLRKFDDAQSESLIVSKIESWD